MKKDDTVLKEEGVKEELTIDCKDQQIAELTNNWKRALADYQNLVKRYEIEKADFVAYANTNLILRLLAVLDHFERAQEYLKDPGLELAIKQLKEVLLEEGLTEIGVLDKEFNPEEMEAVEVIEGKESGKVAEVISKGYRLKNKVIRVAKVKVVK
ncbi:MAG: nucleotide exchange factor GrpE [Patescibacteria group bacterium]|jgi:molecular chaperone GrpE